jgi:uncharacterized protein (TIGR02594 family)
VKWYEIAQSELGVKEAAGNDDNPRIVEYLSSVPNAGQTHDSTPWCAGFANWCLEQSGHPTTQSLMARSFLGYGKACKPQKGCIVVLKRGKPPNGHVGFYSHAKDGRVFLLGGNQGDGVSLASFPESDVIDYRMPSDVVKLDRKVLGTVAAGGGAVVSNIPNLPAVPDLAPLTAWQGFGEQVSGLLSWAGQRPMLTACLVAYLSVVTFLPSIAARLPWSRS